MASCLEINKKLTNHSMRKTLVSKLKKAGKPRNVICEITGHARESLDDYDEIDENQRKELSYLISGYKVPNGNPPNDASKQNAANEASANQKIAVQRAPLVHRMAAFTCASAGSPVSSQNYTGCTSNLFSEDNEKSQPQPQKKRRAYIIESDDDD